VLFTYGIDSQSISFTRLFEKTEEYKQKSIKEFLVFIMQQWLVEQHYITAFNKMLQNRDGFYYEYIDGLYVWKYGFDIRFQDIRMTSLMQVMTDLNML
jgi:competence CoiA-like predicted nuclease